MSLFAGEIIPKRLDEEIRISYLDYAMSVIIGRAIPDVKDGLKPVQRRILYVMYEMGLRHNKPFKKSARVVGEVLGKYHPHGDSAVYEALVRMAQGFSMRYPLIEGHGNFGSVDGDPPAAMRYTEARLSALGEYLLQDIEKNTVPFRPNFDESLMEPEYLPSVIPNLLINGSSGIAVGMSTNIPPHNLSEIVDAIVAYIDNPSITIVELMDCVKGPDFPTGGIITNPEEIVKIYATGSGRLRVRAKVDVEPIKGGKEAIVITEIPYQVSKGTILEKIAQLVKNGKITEIADLRDESDREGMRVVVELKRGESAYKVLNKLFKYTQLETVYSVNMLAIVDGVPVTLKFKQLLELYVKHRENVIIRRTEYDLAKAKDRLEVVTGFLIAIANIEEVVEMIKTSESTAEAKMRLTERFELTEKQAQAILDMQLSKLVALEVEKLEEERRKLEESIKRFEEILASHELRMEIVKKELIELKDKFGDERRTQIGGVSMDLTEEEEEDTSTYVVTLSSRGYLKKVKNKEYRAQKRGGKGVLAGNYKEEDYPVSVVTVRGNDYLMLFTNMGRVYTLPVSKIPEVKREGRGTMVSYLVELKKGERVGEIARVFSLDKGKVFSVTKRGMGKVTLISDLKSSTRRTGLIFQGLEDGDEVVGVLVFEEEENFVVASSDGNVIVFSSNDVRETGRGARGVRIMKLSGNNKVIGAARQRNNVLFVTSRGYGKITPFEEFRLQRRGGVGIRGINCSGRTGELVAIASLDGGEDLVMITQNGKIIRIPTDGIAVQKRYASGVKLVDLSKDDRVMSIAVIKEEDES